MNALCCFKRINYCSLLWLVILVLISYDSKNSNKIDTNSKEDLQIEKFYTGKGIGPIKAQIIESDLEDQSVNAGEVIFSSLPQTDTCERMCPVLAGVNAR